MIPKIIHFVWVGDAPKPELVQKCISTWRQFCPDYEFVEWGNDELAKIDNRYVQEAAACRKWAFVSDYIRLFAIKEFGGFYFDTDLEITGNIDEFLSYGFVMGFERGDGKTARPMSALIGATKGNKIISDLLAEYNQLHFINNGMLDQTANTTRFKKYLRKEFGLKRKLDGEEKVMLRPGSVIFPYYYFCRPVTGESNFAIHHFDGSWTDAGKRKLVFSAGDWRLLKFSFPAQSKDEIKLYNTEKKILSMSLTLGKRRSLVLAKRIAGEDFKLE